MSNRRAEVATQGARVPGPPPPVAGVTAAAAPEPVCGRKTTLTRPQRSNARLLRRRSCTREALLLAFLRGISRVNGDQRFARGGTPPRQATRGRRSILCGGAGSPLALWVSPHPQATSDALSISLPDTAVRAEEGTVMPRKPNRAEATLMAFQRQRDSWATRLHNAINLFWKTPHIR